MDTKKEFMKLALLTSMGNVPEDILSNEEANKVTHGFIILLSSLLKEAPDDMEPDELFKVFGSMVIDAFSITLDMLKETK